jgi:radical SAM protein with 4Fe4S-binding SPASM domain
MVSGERIKGTVKVLESSTDIEKNWNEWSNFVENLERQLGIKSFNRPKIDPDKVFSMITDTREISFELQKGLKLQFWRAFTFANSRVDDAYELKYQQEAKYCPHPFTDFGILWNGDVNLCCLDHDATLKVGNVKNNSIENVIKSTSAKKLRDSMYALEKLHPTCAKCQARPTEKFS